MSNDHRAEDFLVKLVNYNVVGEIGYGFIIEDTNGYYYRFTTENNSATLNPFFLNENYEFILGNSGDYVILSNKQAVGTIPEAYKDNLFVEVIPSKYGFVGINEEGEVASWEDYGIHRKAEGVFVDIFASNIGEERLFGLRDTNTIFTLNPGSYVDDYSPSFNIDEDTLILSGNEYDLFISDAGEVFGSDQLATTLEQKLEELNTTVKKIVECGHNYCLVTNSGDVLLIRNGSISQPDYQGVYDAVPVYWGEENSSTRFYDFFYLDQTGGVLNLDDFESSWTDAFVQLEGRSILQYEYAGTYTAIVLDDHSVLRAGNSPNLTTLAAASPSNPVKQLASTVGTRTSFDTDFAILYEDGTIKGGPPLDIDDPYVHIIAADYSYIAVTESGKFSTWKNVYASVGSNSLPILLTNAPPRLLNEDEIFEYKLEFDDREDIDQLYLHASSETATAWLGFDPDTGKFMGLPKQADVGKHEVLVSFEREAFGRNRITFEIEVINVNDEPVLTNAQLETNEDESILDLDFGIFDEDGDEVSISISDGTLGTLFETGDGKLNYVPTPNKNGLETLTATLNDGSVEVTRDIRISVKAVADEPILDTAFKIELFEDDSSDEVPFQFIDADGDEIVFSYDQPQFGKLSLNNSSSFIYEPDENYNGEDQFTFTWTDGTGVYQKEISISVTAVNDIATGQLNVDGSESIGSYLTVDPSNITDIEGLGEFEYAWLRDGEVIQDSDKIKHRVSFEDEGSKIQAQIKFIDGGGNTETVTSNPTLSIEIDRSDKIIQGSDADDTLFSSAGANILEALRGTDTIELWSPETFGSFFYAKNVHTGEKISINGLTRYHSYSDGGEDVDTIMLMDAEVGNAFFLHDAYSRLNKSLETKFDEHGYQTSARIKDIERIFSGDGNDVIDLTSNTFSLSDDGGVWIYGEEGDDIIWASDMHEEINGGAGDDILFGGAGNDTLVGGSGADIFEFVTYVGSQYEQVWDYQPQDTLKFYLQGDQKPFSKNDYVDGKLVLDNLTVALQTTPDWEDINIVYA